jgi:hypothetical protein
MGLNEPQNHQLGDDFHYEVYHRDKPPENLAEPYVEEFFNRIAPFLSFDIYP